MELKNWWKTFRAIAALWLGVVVVGIVASPKDFMEWLKVLVDLDNLGIAVGLVATFMVSELYWKQATKQIDGNPKL